MSSNSEVPLAGVEYLDNSLTADGFNPTAKESESKIQKNIEISCKDNESVSSKCKSASKTKLNVKIRAWNGVATWKWIANDDTCGICRVAFDGCCPGK